MNPWRKHGQPYERVHLILSRNPEELLDVDLEFAQLSCQKDAAEDRRWFREHPDAKERLRPATLYELTATTYPPGTQVLVTRGPDRQQARLFLLAVPEPPITDSER